MKKYEDNRISFAYPDNFKLIRVKKRWGQYDLERRIEKRKRVNVCIQIVPEEVIDSYENMVQNCPFDEFNIGEYYKSVILGSKEGIGHIVTLNDCEHNFIQKRYRYLFPMTNGGLYIEVMGEKEFDIDTYKEILDSIVVKQ